jgi:hypothetical protein
MWIVYLHEVKENNKQITIRADGSWVRAVSIGLVKKDMT